MARAVGRHERDPADDVTPAGTSAFAQPTAQAGDDGMGTTTRTITAGALLALASGSTLAHADPSRTTRPRGRVIHLEPEQAALVAPWQPQAEGGTHVIYLNRCAGGLTLTQGASDSSLNNISSIVTGTVNFPAYPFGDAAWNELVQGTREMYAPFGITVTDVDPTPMPHDEVVICGNDVASGFAGAAGVAPGTCQPIPNAITFVFPETIGNDPRFTIETIAQESAHAWGLDHEFKCEDPMTYLLDCGDKAFLDGDFPCGEYEARACYCGGNTQNSYQTILSLFGPGTPDTAAPSVVIDSPSDGTRFDSGVAFDVAITVADDVAATSADLYVDGMLASSDDSQPFGPWPVVDAPDGSHEFYVEVQDAAGNLGTSDVVTVLVGLADDSGGGTEGAGGDDTGGDDPSAGGDDGGAPGGITGGGAIPPGFGRGTDDGGGCAIDRESTTARAWWCLLVLAVRRRRAR